MKIEIRGKMAEKMKERGFMRINNNTRKKERKEEIKNSVR